MAGSECRIGAIVVCRMDSARLPGKTLASVRGRPLLWYILERARRVPDLAAVVVATSQRDVDQPIVDFCRAESCPVHRGPAENVARRVLDAAEAFEFDWFARLNGDSPFVDRALLSAACEIARADTADFVTNLARRAEPHGVSAELVRTATFRRAVAGMSRPAHFEHVTKFLYEPEAQALGLRVVTVHRSPCDLGAVRMTVDTPDDLERFDRAVAALGEPWAAATFEDALDHYVERSHA